MTNHRGCNGKVLEYFFKPKKKSVMPAVTLQALPTPAASTAGGFEDGTRNILKEIETLKKSVDALRDTVENLVEKVESLDNKLTRTGESQATTTGSRSERAPVTNTKKPVLQEINASDPEVVQAVLEWVQFMVERVGHEGMKEVLDYYADIGWISPKVAEMLLRYADGVRVEIEPDVERPVRLDPNDHAKSLEHILKIKELQERIGQDPARTTST